MTKYYVIAILSGILSSVSQVILKKSANSNKKNILLEYLNARVITAYSITFVCMLLTIIAFKGLPYKYGPVLEALTYIYIMVLSRIFILEKITKRRLLGNITIAVGVIIFSFGK